MTATFGVPWARWLQAQLDEHGWQRGDLIERAPGVTKDRMSKWLRGEEVPRIGPIRSVCTALGVPAVEGLVAAGHLKPDDVGASITERVDVTELTNRELLDEVARRMGESQSAPPAESAKHPTRLRPRGLPSVRAEGLAGEDWAARDPQK